MFNRLFLLFLFVNSGLVFSQNCSIKLQGKIEDLSDKKPLSSVSVFVSEINKTIISKEDGSYELPKLCAGTYHIRLSHIGCETQNFFVQIKADTLINFGLEHSPLHLHELHVESKLNEISPVLSTSLKKENLLEKSNTNLASSLESIAGVNSIKNGSISKPVIQGFSGNRLNILNYGVAQNGQQWGTDHAPEIDPLVAGKIQIIKGAASLAYPGANAGNIILIEPKSIAIEPHIHGLLNYFFETNGNGHGLRAEAQQGSKKIAWRTGLSLKNFSDRKAPTYYLNNTGNKELNADLYLEKKKTNKLYSLYFSTFNASLGILRGSQIGNLEDLTLAFTQKIPFYTEPNFSRKIDAPSQEVSHNLLKLTFKNLPEHKINTEAYVAFQSNLRKEFDIRRNQLSTTPSLSILQNSIHGELKAHLDLKEKNHLNFGIQAKIVDNTNNPETGILPLIPDYRSLEPSAFIVLESFRKNIHLDLGLRYDALFQDVKSISFDLPRRVISYQNNFNNLSASAGFHAKLDPKVNIELQTALGTRNPAINELYSNGLHQGVAGIEIGNVNLVSENAFKNNIGVNLFPFKFLTISLNAYYNLIKNYIYLQVSQEKRLTIRGAFPVFNYAQTNAKIKGLDLDANFILHKNLFFKTQISVIQGLEKYRTMVFLPQNKVKNEVTFENQTHRIKSTLEHIKYFRYEGLDFTQDFVPTPLSSNVFNFTLHKELSIFSKNTKIGFNINNIFNSSYRLYLNRLRYFSDELGRSFVFNLTVNL